MPDAYYYSLLPKPQQQAYHEMREGLLRADASFSVPRLSGEDMTKVFAFVRMDCPEIFWALSYTYRYARDADSVEFIPEYLFPKKQLQAQRDAVSTRVRRLVQQAAGLDEAGKEQYVHDFICRNVRYDKLKKPYSHEIIGPLTQGVGVCEGIAKTVKVLCDALGIPCILAFSENNPEKGIKYRHAWNIVRIGGKYYHLDATFDNSLGAPEAIRYDYYNLGDSAIFRDHEKLVWPVPACPDHGRSWYILNKLSFTKYEEVRSRAAQAVRKGKLLTFHWRGGYLTREVLQELCTILTEEAAKKNRTFELSLNWPQAVLRVRFCDGSEPGSVLMEDANEGEQTEPDGSPA